MVSCHYFLFVYFLSIMIVPKPQAKSAKSHTPEARRIELLERSKKLQEAVMWYDEKKKEGAQRVSFEMAGKLFGFSGSTVNDAYHGKLPKIFAHVKQQLLSVEQENVLVEWACHHGARGVPMDRSKIAAKASHILGRKVGSKWAYNFLIRHSDKLKKKWTQKLDSKRAKQLNPAVVKEHFKTVIKEIVDHDIPKENIWNMDEKGIVCGGKERTKVFISRDQKDATMIGQVERETTTVIECVCADGTAISPMVIFKGKRMSQRWCLKPEEDSGLNAT
jgi:hypothetical protein